MAKRATRDINILPKADFDAFVDELKRRAAIRIVKVADEGTVEPTRRGGVIVMQPRVRNVATAYDPTAHEIIKWEQKTDVGSGVVAASAIEGGGRHRHVDAARTRRELIDALEVEQYQVVPGEWTPQSVREILERRHAQ